MTFGERLSELAEENGFSTRKQLADELGIPSTTLRNYEKGSREPGHSFLKQVSQLFNVSVDYLLGLTDENQIKMETLFLKGFWHFCRKCV